jgi:hypothetical protein
MLVHSSSVVAGWLGQQSWEGRLGTWTRQWAIFQRRRDAASRHFRCVLGLVCSRVLLGGLAQVRSHSCYKGVTGMSMMCWFVDVSILMSGFHGKYGVCSHACVVPHQPVTRRNTWLQTSLIIKQRSFPRAETWSYVALSWLFFECIHFPIFASNLERNLLHCGACLPLDSSKMIFTQSLWIKFWYQICWTRLATSLRRRTWHFANYYLIYL